MPEGRAAIQTDRDGLKKWADRSLMEFNKKCQVLLLGKNNPIHQHMLGATQLGNRLAGRGLKGPVGHQVQHEPAMCPCHTESWWCPALHQAKH